MLCKYKNLFGELGKGIHSYRIFNIAYVDVLSTVFAALIIHLLIPRYNFFTILIFLFILGIILHRLFCVRTTVDRLIFG